jgi:signal transduction histidine kinase
VPELAERIGHFILDLFLVECARERLVHRARGRVFRSFPAIDDDSDVECAHSVSRDYKARTLVSLARHLLKTRKKRFSERARGQNRTASDITIRRKEKEALRTPRHRLRDLSAHLEAAREEERRDLARALHDEIGQLLTGIRLEVSAAVRTFQDTRVPEQFAVVDRLQAAVGLVDLSISTVQRITSSLRPPILDHLGLLPAIRWEAAVFERRTGIRCLVSAVPAGADARGHINVLCRILLEALTNVARHANAGTVWIRIRQRAKSLTVEIRDDGRGISDAAIESPRTMGLIGMRERALAIGGTVNVTRAPAGGTRVLVTVPLEAGSTASRPTGSDEPA